RCEVRGAWRERRAPRHRGRMGVMVGGDHGRTAPASASARMVGKALSGSADGSPPRGWVPRFSRVRDSGISNLSPAGAKRRARAKARVSHHDEQIPLGGGKVSIVVLCWLLGMLAHAHPFHNSSDL